MQAPFKCCREAAKCWTTAAGRQFKLMLWSIDSILLGWYHDIAKRVEHNSRIEVNNSKFVLGVR